MAREISAGGVLVRPIKGEWCMAAIEPQGRDSPASAKKTTAKTVLALPKGLVDVGEKPEETALREVREETGLTGTLVTKLRDIKYFYRRTWAGGERVFKIVNFYLLLYQSGRMGEISQEMKVEVRRALWLPMADAPQKLAYRGEREVAKLALAYLHSHPELMGDREAG
ncbi:MAG TPA: NUDIX domain-containing protein [Terriglobales bacterium]|nr:NUDIX domain-containing protein [Terriglobales bacterium]